MSATATPGLLGPQQLDGMVYSDGWRRTGARCASVEPATGEVLAEVGAAGAGDVLAAARTAATAQPAWAASDPFERAAAMTSAAAALDDHREEICSWLVREAGSIEPKAQFEVDQSIKELRQAAVLASSAAHGEALADSGELSVARRVPIGVVGVITPWNFPLVLAMRSLAPALALGNAVILKCDPHTPVSGGLAIARVFEEAGLPAGVLHVLPGEADAGAALPSAPEVGMVSFTGSTTAGRKVGAACGEQLKRVVLELGGKNSLIVLDDADLEAASSAGAWASFLHQGQICIGTGRHLVHEKVADAYLERLVARAAQLPVGNPAIEQVALGPIIDARQLERVGAIVRDTVAAGARVLSGGEAAAPYFPPTVIAGVRPGMPAWRDEIFGPVAPVATFSDEEEAIALANDTEYGLTASVYTRDLERGRRIADRLRAGMTHVNDQSVKADPRMPFGGMGASGNGGRFGGDASLDEFTQWRWSTERQTPIVYPF